MRQFSRAAIVLVLIGSWISSAEVIRRNFSWSIEGKNDPILHVTNEGEKSIEFAFRLLFGDDSYRDPVTLEVPAGENRFIRISEIVERIGKRYPKVKEAPAGLLQVEFEGVDRNVKARLINLNPKTGVSSDSSEGQRTPVIRSIDPKSGDPEGGTVVTIVGENFDESSSVKFGGVPALRNRQSDEILVAVAPKHPAGAVDIEVSNGKRVARLRNVFRYEAEGPVITKVDPDSGPVRGGIRVTITGLNFQRGVTVRWNGKPVAARYDGPQQISLQVPEGRSGPVNLEVVNPDGKTDVLSEAFLYKGYPEIVSIAPSMGSTEGGYNITVNGSNFEDGSSILFGSQYGPTTFINPRALAAVTPPGESGYVDITVSNPDGETDTLQNGFLYNEPPEIIAIVANPNPIVRNTTTTIRVDATDPEANAMDYEYRVAQGPAGGAVTGNGNQATYKSPNTTGKAIIQVTVYDEYRAKAQGNIEIAVE